VSSPRKALLAVVLVSLWTLGLSSSASAADCQNTNVQAPALSLAQLESSVGCLVNEQRTSHGLDPLEPNATLHAAAASHSNEMVSEGYFEHTSPAGVTFIDRIASAGYMRGARTWVVGENLIWGTGELSSPQSIVTDWMESPPHRENILRGRFKEFGIAAVPGTPEDHSDVTGVTISNEFGVRTKGQPTRRTRKARGSRS
jgi:uncharacterized protein YkwD